MVCIKAFSAEQVTRKKPGPKPKPKASKAATKVAAQNKKPVVRGGRGMAGESAKSVQCFISVQLFSGRQILTDEGTFCSLVGVSRIPAGGLCASWSSEQHLIG